MPAEESMNDTVVIVTGAEPLDPDTVGTLPAEAIVIAADGGVDHALAAGLSPGGVIGDLDSISPEGLVWAEAHATIQRHPEGKDQTDTELAVGVAAAMHPARLILIAGGGDRLDHTFAAIGALGAPELTGIPLIECWWGRQYARVLHGPGRAAIHLTEGARVSVLALHGPCTGVSVSGTRWELDREALPALIGRGISNLAESDTVNVELTTGVLTVFIGPGTDQPGLAPPISTPTLNDAINQTESSEEQS
jgi:thiamine pyrophosphokinase